MNKHKTRLKNCISSWWNPVSATSLCLLALSGCSGRQSVPQTTAVRTVTVTQVREAPKVSFEPYQPCRLPENLPLWFNDYPAYVVQTASAVDQCNQINKAASEYNAATQKEMK